MAYDLVTSVTVRPDGLVQFQEAVATLAAACQKKKEPWRYTAHQTLFGQSLTLHFASQAESFEGIQELGTVEELWLRVLGEQAGLEAMGRANDSIQNLEQTVSVDRPDLSYAEGIGSPAEYPYAVVTTAQARPGHTEAAEELTRMIVYQVVFGQIGAYWTVRPLASLAELDQQLPAPELLTQAFGNAEGGLIWRSGTEAVEQARREVLRFRPDLSHPPAG